MGGLLRASDLAGYRARLEPPLRTTFAGREILGQSAWTQGPVLMQVLGMLAGFDLQALGHNSVRYIHVVTETLKLAFADRERHYGDCARTRSRRSARCSRRRTFESGRRSSAWTAPRPRRRHRAIRTTATAPCEARPRRRAPEALRPERPPTARRTWRPSTATAT